MRRVLLVAFVSMAFSVTYGQESTKRWRDNPRLQWIDFEGKVNDTSKYDAECFANIGYDYVFYGPDDFEFNVYADFDKYNSWRREEMQSEDLLRHEQLHFNIAELFANKLQEEFERFSYSENYEAEIVEIFNRVTEAYHLMQDQYDEETNHSLNKDKQKEWEILSMNN